MTPQKSRPGLTGGRRGFCSQRNIKSTREGLKGASQEQSCSFNPSLGYHNPKEPAADHHADEKLLLLEVLEHFSPPVHRDVCSEMLSGSVGGNKVAGKMSNIQISLYLCLRP